MAIGRLKILEGGSWKYTGFGPKGATGPIGSKGETGAKGATGSAGAKGETGPKGATGVSKWQATGANHIEPTNTKKVKVFGHSTGPAGNLIPEVINACYGTGTTGPTGTVEGTIYLKYTI